MSVQYVTIEKGKIVNRTAVRNRFAELADGQYRMTIEKANKRSDPQNRYLHGVLFPELAKAFEQAGYKPMNAVIAKNIAKKMFMTKAALNPDTADLMEYVQDTRDASTTEINELIEAVIQFSAEQLQYTIPYPNEQTQLYQ